MTKNYVTGIIGKWHLGAHESLRPNQRGFDEFFGHLTGGHRFFPEELTLQDETEVKAHSQAYRTKILRNTTRVDIDDYFCLLYTSPSPRDGLLSRMPSSA